VEVSKFPRLGLLRFWGPITLCVDLQLRWNFKQSCTLHWELPNGMWHARKSGESRLLVIGSQIDNLTPNPFFDHNLCFKCPNGSCEPILDIYVSRAFQSYKELFNPMCFDSYSCYLKIRKSIKTPTPKVGVHLGVWGFILSHSPTLLKAWNVIPGLHFWPTPSQALALVASPKLRLWQTMFIT